MCRKDKYLNTTHSCYTESADENSIEIVNNMTSSFMAQSIMSISLRISHKFWREKSRGDAEVIQFRESLCGRTTNPFSLYRKVYAVQIPTYNK